MSEVKVYRLSGKINKPNFKTEFKKEVRALNPEDATEKVYMLLGSKHRVKRFQLKIYKVEEVNLEDIEDIIIRKMTPGAETSVE
jgi:large subunit ribosomal protein LX